MERIQLIDAGMLLPSREVILNEQGVPADAPLSPLIEESLEEARAKALRMAEPISIRLEISLTEFETIFQGEGRNEVPNPVEVVYPSARRLALFAVTLGQKISRAVEKGFEKQDYLSAFNLDTVASLMADRAAQILSLEFSRETREARWEWACLPYSPGYCGWDLTGQRSIVKRLQPEKIGIKLTRSCLMQPIKSVSGVLLAGPKRIHTFPNSYTFCRSCVTRNCRDRIRTALGNSQATDHPPAEHRPAHRCTCQNPLDAAD